MKAGLTVQELTREIVRTAELKEDYAIPSQQMSVSSNGHTDLRLGDAGVFDVNQVAHRQLASWLDVPAGYYDFLRANTGTLTVELPRRSNAPLFDVTLNALLRGRPAGERRLVRTLDGRARAVLSDRYRMLDNEDIASYLLPILMELPSIDWDHSSMQVTETKLYIKIVSTAISAEVKVGDVVNMGVIITNSEVGYGALSVQPLSFRRWCANGAVHNTLGSRKYHSGARLGGNGDDELSARFFKDDTLRARDQALMLELRDIVRGAMSEATLGQIVDQMREADGIAIKPADAIGVVENVTKRFRLNGDESAAILNAFMEGPSNHTTPGFSLWGLSNAVTFVAQSEGIEYDRSTELEELGGKLIALPKSELRDLLHVNSAQHN